MQCRNWCFTVNNWTEEDIAGLQASGYTYMIYGREVGKNGTPHLQGYIEFGIGKRLTTMKNINGRAHWEPRKGTQEQAVKYCKKDNDFEEFGEMKTQGLRKDLDAVRQNALESGMRMVTSYYNAQQIRVAQIFLSFNEEPRDWVPEVIWLWGPTGTGKSKLARELLDGDVYVKNTGNKWWNGYDGHEEVIIDDFRDDWWTLVYMLGLLDRYSFEVECKGGGRQFRARRIVVTSARSPQQCWVGSGEQIGQLIRRITRVQEVSDVTEVTGNTDLSLNFEFE